ncbi:hypothetical protein FQA39_LY00358 [Lamprigera yunnana]|nr:hypothetical protein FQA39_LY00358 [Lamprigera yunnana]
MANRFLYGVEIKKNNSIECITLSKKVVENDMSMHLDKLTAINVQSSEIRNALGNPCSILCSIYILPNELINIDTTHLKDKIKNERGLSAVDSDILLELECPVCNEYMVPPIYQCVVGHSICGTCKPLMNECSTCRDKIAATRNFSLEKLTRIIKYNCKYIDLDCPFQLNSEEIKDHEANCKFGPYNCPFDEFRECKWKRKLSNIIYHAKTCHEDDILEVNYLTRAYLDTSSEDTDEDCYIIKSFGGLFRIIFKFCSKMFYWSIQYVGPSEEAEKFMYELDIDGGMASNLVVVDPSLPIPNSGLIDWSLCFICQNDTEEKLTNPERSRKEISFLSVLLLQVTAAVLYNLMLTAYEKSIQSADDTPTESFEDWYNKKSNTVLQFKYCDMVLKLELVVLQLIKSLRLADFSLYKDSLSHLIGWFFVFHQVHYARWLAVHIRDLANLPQTHPDVNTNFEAGNFVAMKTKRAFSAIALDQNHEQVNACLKRDGGKIQYFPRATKT